MGHSITDPARLVKIIETRHMSAYLSRWTASFTANSTMAFCFDSSLEGPQPYGSGPPQGSLASPVLFLIYAHAMLEAPAHQKDRDVSYLDDDGAPQMALTRQTGIGKLQERMELRLQRGAQLNLPYDLGKTGLIHLWSPPQQQAPHRQRRPLPAGNRHQRGGDLAVSKDQTPGRPHRLYPDLPRPRG